MRIRKRTPVRAASPGLSASPPPPPFLSLPLQQQPKVQDKPQEEDDRAEQEEEEEEEKRVILIAGALDDPVPAAAAAASEDMPSGAAPPKPDPQYAAAARCSRNDGKRWRCKGAAAPGYLFCDRHVAWSTRKRKPRATKKLTSRGGGAEDDMARLGRDGGGFVAQHKQPGSRKRDKDGGAGPAA